MTRDPADPGGRPLLLHVGYHKTATTWLQTTVFRPRPGCAPGFARS